MDVGFIGLGIMGAPMAGHLIAHGHRLHRKTRRSVPEPPLPAGDIASAREVAERSDVVIREGAVTAERCERGCNVHGRPYRVLGKQKGPLPDLVEGRRAGALLGRRADLLADPGAADASTASVPIGSA